MTEQLLNGRGQQAKETAELKELFQKFARDMGHQVDMVFITV